MQFPQCQNSSFSSHDVQQLPKREDIIAFSRSKDPFLPIARLKQCPTNQEAARARKIQQVVLDCVEKIVVDFAQSCLSHPVLIKANPVKSDSLATDVYDSLLRSRSEVMAAL